MRRGSPASSFTTTIGIYAMTDTIITTDDRIATMLESGMERDEIIISLVSEHGKTLNAATSFYATYARENGLSKAVVSHKASAINYLGRNWTLEEWTPSAVLVAMEELSNEYGVALSTARDYCKAYSETLGVPLPTTDPRAAMFDWITDNIADMSRDELRKEFLLYAVDVLGRSKSNANEYAKGLDLHFHIIDNS